MNDIATKSPGNTLTSVDFNATQEDLENAVISSDQTLDPAGTAAGDKNMTGKAMAGYSGAAWGYTDSGSANAHVISIASNLKAITKYFDNLIVAYLPGNTSTSNAVTVNVSTLGVKNIRLPGGTLPLIGSISSTHILVLKYNNGAGYFEIISGLNAPTIANFTNAQHDHGDADDGGALVPGINLTTPNISSFVNAQHDHKDAAEGGDATFFKVSNFTRDTSLSSGSQAITGIGFKPKAIIFFVAQGNSSEVSWGFSDGSQDHCIFDNHPSTSDTYDDSAIQAVLVNEGSGNFYNGKVNSLDIDGFTMSWVKTGSPTGTLVISYLAIR